MVFGEFTQLLAYFFQVFYYNLEVILENGF